MAAGIPNKRERLLALATLIVGSYLFRLPPLLNARSTNSDAAVVGLQAMHVLRGEHAAFLWGSGYQTVADSYVAAGFFAIFGASPFVLMFSSLTLHVVATALVFVTLAKRFRPWMALGLTLPLILSPSSVHSYALYPPRELALLLAIAALCAIDRLWFVLGGVLYGLAVSADPYPLVLAPITLGLAFLLGWRGLAKTIAGSAVGLVPFLLLHRLQGESTGQMRMTPDVIDHNWRLLVDECLPWALSYKVYFAKNVMDYQPWDAPFAFTVVGLVGAMGVFAIAVLGFVRFRRGRELGLAASATFPVVIGAFLLSVMVMDHFSMRYLAVLTLLLPFAAATAAEVLGPRVFLLLGPHVVAAAIAGWVGYGPFVRGPLPVSETPELADDYALFDALRSRDITYAQADYWASYRLTFLFGERIIVVPMNEGEDRYPPYRAAFDASRRTAYIYDPNRSREEAPSEGEPLRIGRLQVFVKER